MFVQALVHGLVRRAVVVGVVGVGAGGFYVYDQYDKKAHYVPVQARVTDISEQCMMEKRSGRTREYSDMIACDTAEMAVRVSPKWQGFDIKRYINISYEYISPADKKTHIGKRQYTSFPNGKRLSRGELFQVRASKTDPSKSREI